MSLAAEEVIEGLRVQGWHVATPGFGRGDRHNLIMLVPPYTEGARVVLQDEHDALTHGLATRVDPNVAAEPLVDGIWKLWYYMKRDDLDKFHVVAWKELEQLR